MATATTIAIIDTFTKLRKLARTIDKVNEDAKEHGIYPDKNMGILKFSLETTRESKE